MKYRFLTLCFLFSIVIIGCSKSPESTVQNFYHSIEKGDILEAKKYLSAQMLVSGDTIISAGLSAVTSQFNSCGNIKDLSISLSGTGAVRTGKATVTFNGKCPPSTDRMKLITEDGKWKIYIVAAPISSLFN